MESNKNDDLIGNTRLSEELRISIVVNVDAKMGKGKIASQVGHVIMLITEYLLTYDKELYINYKQSGMPKIVLRANLDIMNTLLKDLELSGSKLFPTRDAGRTQIAPKTLTAIGFLPMTDEERNNSFPILSTLKLL